MKDASVPGRAPRRRFLLFLLVPAALFLAAVPLSVVRVPEGSFGLAASPHRGKPLPPGLRFVRPFSRVDLYPEGPIEVEGTAPSLTPEGAARSIRYRFTVQAEPAGGILPGPRREAGASPDSYAAELGALAAGLLSAPAGTQGTRPEEAADALRAGLEAAGLSVLALEAGAADGPAPRTLRNPILLVGLDGADWQILDPLIAAGRTPNLARLKERSLWGHMRSFEPVLSPLLWTTAATGRSPDEHGVIDFLVPDPATGKRLPTTSRNRRVRALWDIFTERGLSADVVAWWASWPADPIHGRMVSDRVAYSLFDVAGETRHLTWPESLWGRLQGSVTASETIDHERLSRFIDVTREEHDSLRSRAAQERGQEYRDPVSHLAKIVASTETYHRMALALLKEGQPDLFAVYYQGIDEVGHRFAHYMPPRLGWVGEKEFRAYHRAVEAFYIYQDELLGELLAAASPESRVLVLSDHGFQNGASRPTDGPADIEGKPGKWHRLYGIVMLAGAGIRPGRLDSATLYDVAPTVLALAGLPVARDMTGHPLIRRQDAGAGSAEPVASYETSPFRDRIPGGETAGPAPGPSAADEELMRNLSSLGYIGAVPAPEPEASSAPSLAGAAAASVTSHTNLAAVLMRKGDLRGAEAELRRALSAQPGYFPALMTLGQVLVRQDRLAEALAVTREAIVRHPEAEDGAFVQLALLASRSGQRAQAASFLEALGEKRPDSSGVQIALGLLEAEAGEPVPAERHYRAALALQPGSTEAMRCFFALFRSKGREAELEPEVRAALELNDRSVLHLNWLGLILAGRGEAAQAEKQYRRALELAPDFAGTMANLGALYGRTGRVEEAVTILSRALRIEPRNLEARINLGAALARQGRLEELIASLEEARSLGIRSTEILNALGLALAQSGREAEAKERLNESLALSPDQPKVRSLLSELDLPR